MLRDAWLVSMHMSAPADGVIPFRCLLLLLLPCTVASMINLGVVSLLQHPDQLKALKQVCGFRGWTVTTAFSVNRRHATTCLCVPSLQWVPARLNVPALCAADVCRQKQH